MAKARETRRRALYQTLGESVLRLEVGRRTKAEIQADESLVAKLKAEIEERTRQLVEQESRQEE